MDVNPKQRQRFPKYFNCKSLVERYKNQANEPIRKYIIANAKLKF
jgi:hypothetical protein